MTALIIIAIAYCIYRICKGSAERRQAERAARERERIRQEQAAIREQMRMDRERAKEETRARIDAEKQRLAWQKRQDAINRQAAQERERLKKEQERQAKEQARLAEEQNKMRYVLAQAVEDIDFLVQRIADLDSQLDYQLLLQTSSLPGSKQFEKCQSKIVTLRNQIHCAESRLARASYNKDTAQRKLA